MDIDFVLNQLSWDTWHVGRLPSEDIFVVLKKVGEREFYFAERRALMAAVFEGSPVPRSICLMSAFSWWCEDAGLFSRYL